MVDIVACKRNESILLSGMAGIFCKVVGERLNFYTAAGFRFVTW